MARNKELTKTVGELQAQLETAAKEKAELETAKINAIVELSLKEQERTGKCSDQSPSTEEYCR